MSHLILCKLYHNKVLYIILHLSLQVHNTKKIDVLLINMYLCSVKLTLTNNKLG